MYTIRYRPRRGPARDPGGLGRSRLRIDLVRSESIELHVTAVAGQATRGNFLDSRSGGCNSDWRGAIGGLGGLDFRLDSLGLWSAGVEAGYSHATDGLDDPCLI